MRPDALSVSSPSDIIIVHWSGELGMQIMFPS